jgi:hypothetical protein
MTPAVVMLYANRKGAIPPSIAWSTAILFAFPARFAMRRTRETHAKRVKSSPIAGAGPADLLSKSRKWVLALSLLIEKAHGLTAWTASVQFAVCLPKKQTKKPL